MSDGSAKVRQPVLRLYRLPVSNCCSGILAALIHKNIAFQDSTPPGGHFSAAVHQARSPPCSSGKVQRWPRYRSGRSRSCCQRYDLLSIFHRFPTVFRLFSGCFWSVHAVFHNLRGPGGCLPSTGAAAAVGQFQWKNPDFRWKNPDFLCSGIRISHFKMLILK